MGDTYSEFVMVPIVNNTLSLFHSEIFSDMILYGTSVVIFRKVLLVNCTTINVRTLVAF